jgi:hypothetical protein
MIAAAGGAVMFGILVAAFLLTAGGLLNEPLAAGLDQTVSGQTITGVLKVEAGDEYYITRDDTGTERVLRRSSNAESGEISLKLGDRIETVETAEGRVSSIKRTPAATSEGYTLRERASGPK